MTHATPQRIPEGECAPGSHRLPDAKHETEQEPSQRQPTPTPSAAPLPKSSAAPHLPGRRGFLQLLGFGSAVAATLAIPSTAGAAARRRTFPGVLVFRLTTRRHHACNACRHHHRFMVFRTHALADRHRAHPGCNCPIVRQKLSRRDFARLFGPRGVAPTGVADLRRTPLHTATVAVRADIPAT